jgi:hypothetical protein
MGANPVGYCPSAQHVSPSIQELKANGVTVYPVEANLAVAHPPTAGTFPFTLAGPPGLYRVHVTTDFEEWTNLALLTNMVGTATFVDSTTGQRPRSFYLVEMEQ